MDEVSSHFRLDLPTARPRKRLFYLILESHDGRAQCRVRREARARERHQHTATVDSLKVLDPERPIREADMYVPRFCSALLGQNPIAGTA